MELTERITRLERNNRRLTLLLIFALAAAPASWLLPRLGAQGEKVGGEFLEKFALKNSQGVAVATLWSSNTGANLSLNDATGRPRMVFAVGADGPTLLMLDKDQSTANRGIRLAMKTNNSNGPSVSLFGDDPKTPLASLRTKPAAGERANCGMLMVVNDTKQPVMFPRTSSDDAPVDLEGAIKGAAAPTSEKGSD